MQTAQTEKEKHTLCSRLNTASLLCYSPLHFSFTYPLSLDLLFPLLLPLLPFLLAFSRLCFSPPSCPKSFPCVHQCQHKHNVYTPWCPPAPHATNRWTLFPTKSAKVKGCKTFSSSDCGDTLSGSLLRLVSSLSLSVYLLNSFTANPFEVLDALSARLSLSLLSYSYIN